MKRLCSLLGIVTIAAAVLLSYGQRAAALLIDDFNVAQQVDSATAPGSSNSASEGLGGERDMRTIPPGLPGIIGDTNTPSILTINKTFTGAGLVALQYDGIDGSAFRDTSGLGGLDLTADGSDRFVVKVESSDNAGGMNIFVYTNDDDVSGFALPSPGGITTSTLLEAPFSSFAIAGTGVGADFTNVGAIEFTVISAPASTLQLQIDSIQTSMP